jgi:anti-sigma factor RsiW
LAVNINISNYEEFLLSAIDGELNGEEMAALEAFMQQHPAIRNELALLQSTKLHPDEEKIFGAKASLYRGVPDTLSASNYERFLLDYVDNELNASDRIAVEALVGQHPHIRQELALLQAARVAPDLSVTFGDKASLYKKERTQVRPLWKWSAAAAVIVGVAVWFITEQRTGRQAQVADNIAVRNDSPAPLPQIAPQVTAPLVSDAGTSSGSMTQTAPVSTPAPANTSVDEGQRADNGSRNASSAPALARIATDKGDRQRPASDVTANEKNLKEDNRIPDNRLPVLAKIPQPASTSGEVVQQLQEKTQQQERILAENVVAVVEKPAVMANADKISDAVPAVAAPANVKGELVVAVTMNGDSKLLNGVANVARFLSRKKK